MNHRFDVSTMTYITASIQATKLTGIVYANLDSVSIFVR